MKSFVAACITLAAAALSVTAEKGKAGPGKRLYNCIDAHGDANGKVSLLELGEAFRSGTEEGVIPNDIADSFMENADLTKVLEGRMDEDEIEACGGSDGKITAGELV